MLNASLIEEYTEHIDATDAPFGMITMSQTPAELIFTTYVYAQQVLFFCGVMKWFESRRY